VTARRVESSPELQHVVAQGVWRQTTSPTVPPPIADSEDDNAVVLALGTKDDSPLARLRAGEATSLVLLSATALGLASCPVVEPLETTEARDTMQANLFSIVGIPQILLRIGWPPVDAEALPAPARLPLEDVSEWMGHQSLTSA
jgi:hypothetical protein